VDDCDVTAALEELHYFFAFGGELGPAGLGFGVLFEGAEWFALELEINLSEFAFGGAADGVGVVCEDDPLRGVYEGLFPDGEDALLEFRGMDIDGHERSLAQWFAGEENRWRGLAHGWGRI
jgi:hypothetical protein